MLTVQPLTISGLLRQFQFLITARTTEGETLCHADSTGWVEQKTPKPPSDRGGCHQHPANATKHAVFAPAALRRRQLTQNLGMFREPAGFVLAEDQSTIDFHVENTAGTFNQF